jgi:hypothetical protein
MQEGGVEPETEPLDLVECGAIGRHQFFQAEATDRGGVAAVCELGAVHRIRYQVGVQCCIVLQIQLLFALLELVQGRQADIDVATLDQGRHLPVEEREQQGPDV